MRNVPQVLSKAISSGVGGCDSPSQGATLEYLHKEEMWDHLAEEQGGAI
jgi:hypothetical protein